MAPVLRRVAAFTPLVVLAILTAAAAVVGERTGDETGAFAVPTPTAASRLPTPGPASLRPALPAVVPPAAGPSVTVTGARRSWSRAIDRLVHAASGRYSWSVYLDGNPEPFQAETGAFDLDPFRSAFDRTVALGSGRTQLIHVRRFTGTTYMQMEHWGSWTGCWLRVTDEQIERASGADLSDTLPLPVSVLAISDAVVSRANSFWFGPPYREFGARVNAAEALLFLGVPGTVVQRHLSQLTTIQAPITISLDAAGRLHGGGARGEEVAAAITRAAPHLLEQLGKDLPRLNAAFSVSGLGAPVKVAEPPTDSVLPLNAKRSDSCTSGGPRA